MAPELFNNLLDSASKSILHIRQILYIFKIRHIYLHLRTQAFAVHMKFYVGDNFTNNKREGSKWALSLANPISCLRVLYHVTCSNCSEREESYDIMSASIKYSGDMFVPYKEVVDMFVPYMEA
jgi:hypothetical protein